MASRKNKPKREKDLVAEEGGNPFAFPLANEPLANVQSKTIQYLQLAEASLAGSQTYPRNVQLLFQASQLYEAGIVGLRILADRTAELEEKTKLQARILDLTVQQLHVLGDYYYYIGDIPNDIKYHRLAASAMEKCLSFFIENGLIAKDGDQALYWQGRINSLMGDALEGEALISEEKNNWSEAADYHLKEREYKERELDFYKKVTRDEKSLSGSKARMLSAEQSRLVCMARDCMSRGDSALGLSYLKQASITAEETHQVSPDWYPYRAIADNLRTELRNLLRITAKNRVNLKYTDLEIKIGTYNKDNNCIIEASSSVAGEASGSFKLPVSDLELGHFLGFLSSAIGRNQGVLRGSSSERHNLESFGKKIYDALFQDPDIRKIFDRTTAIAFMDDMSGLRLRLIVDDPVLRSVPWEFLHDGEQFVVVSQRTPVVRYLRLTKPIKPMQVVPPLRMLVAVSSPTDLPALDVKSEWQRLVDALGPASLLVKIDLLERTSYSSLQRTLSESYSRGEGYHILHYIGHGTFNDGTKRGFLALETENGTQAEYFGGDVIGNLLRDHPTVRLVVLNSCQGAHGSPEQSFAGVAESLVRVGVPAVVAMQFSISDRAAIVFTDYFYSSLSLGYPVDAAMSEARKAIFAIPENVEFGTPVLFMRSDEGVLFDMSKWAE